MVLGFTQPLTEMSTRYIFGGKAQPVRYADNLAAISESNVKKILGVSQPYRPPQPVAGTALLLLYFIIFPYAPG
jgi:hypothetical protein